MLEGGHDVLAAGELDSCVLGHLGDLTHADVLLQLDEVGVHRPCRGLTQTDVPRVTGGVAYPERA